MTNRIDRLRRWLAALGPSGAAGNAGAELERLGHERALVTALEARITDAPPVVEEAAA